MDESIVERGEDVRNTENELALSNLRSQRDGGFFLWCLGFLGRLEISKVISVIQTRFGPSIVSWAFRYRKFQEIYRHTPSGRIRERTDIPFFDMGELKGLRMA